MPKIMKNLVVLLEPPENDYDISYKAGNMYMNRFCIDEDAAFELSGVIYFKKRSFSDIIYPKDEPFERKSKGKGY